MAEIAQGQRPTVYVVEDDPDVVRFLETLLGSVELHVESCGSAREFLDRYRPRANECLLLDIRLPEVDGMELQRELGQRGADLPIVMMTGFGSTTTAVEAMKRGAIDYIEKPFNVEKLLKTVRAALARDSEAKREAIARREVDARMSRLTKREREVLELVVAGHPSKDIADKLGLAKKTVDLHRSHIMTKLEAGSVVDLVTMALTGRRTLRQSQREDS